VEKKAEDLIRDGWTRQCVVDRHRADEFRELYDALELEMCAVDATPELIDGECTECFVDGPSGCVVIFTRPKD
jgi:hypothetical protein